MFLRQVSHFLRLKRHNQFCDSLQFATVLKYIHLRRPVKFVTRIFEKEILTLAILFISIAGKILICFRILSSAVFAVINNILLLLNSRHDQLLIVICG